MATFDDYVWLTNDASAAAALAAGAAHHRVELQQLNELRKSLPAERARLVVEQLDLRRRAAAKFGVAASAMFFTPVQLEQATGGQLAAYKAERFRRAGGDRLIHDCCCGIGGDLVALAACGPAVGYDLSPTICLLAEKNLAVAALMSERSRDYPSAVREGDVTALVPDAREMWHVDPDRRADGRRSTTLEQHSPGPAVIDRWRSSASDGAVKLAPASEPPAAWQHDGELEWITAQRECRQLVVWFGQLAMARGKRRATVLLPAQTSDRCDAGVSVASFVGEPREACSATDAPHQFLYDPDPAIVASQLLGAIANRHGLHSLGAGGAYLTGDDEVAEPLLSGFKVEETLPLRTAAVAAWLAARHIGRVEVKKRGVSLDPEQFRRDLKLRGDDEATVILTRVGKRQLAIVARRLDRPGG
ncbi:THUMP-like domain-containing protein [Lacipirellula limnantheis]|uniref:THUMP-like domain-containing protein n=1 Tax=Lacipirellula limnantheis TaxID=2528024 RepID=A0A517TZY9_9BACT|nr:hypothetical protein [Lacipirellula limnantheis]QDT73947.1 hypothetical protein I41_31390 [Lacipirellula limnantheis]